MKGRIMLLLVVLSFTATVAETATQLPSKLGSAVYIITPAHGEVVSSPVKVRFGLSGMGVAPAGVAISETGHHHLLIDVEGQARLHDPVPKDEQHLHFGSGQTETLLELAPGKHTLQLLLADQDHIPHKPAVVSRKIVIYVE
jgi:hypothetical protein